MDEELLIHLVRERRELYDTEHKLYEDHHRREAAWMEISKIMKMQPLECRERWKRVRDNYRRARKLRIQKKLQGITKVKTIKHEKLMSFIDRVIENNTREVEDSEAGSSQAFRERNEDTAPLADPLTVPGYLEESVAKPDTLITFFANLGETVKTFPEDVQIRVKRDIFKIINEAEEEVCRNKVKITEISMKLEVSDDF